MFASLLCSISFNAQALAPDAQWFTPKPQDTELTDQRYNYELAKSALKNDDLEAFEFHYNKLGKYPLVPYLDYAKIKKDLFQLPYEGVNRFIETNKGTYLEYRVRQQFLGALAAKRKWQDFLSYYRPEINEKAIRCQYLQARLNSGDDSALDETADIWVGGKSHPKACDPLFNKWRKRGGLTNDVAWQRFHNAMQNRKRSLARYVSRFMTADTKKYADKYLEVHAYPGRITKHRNFSEQSEKMQQIISHGIKRYARIDPVSALKHWELYEAQQLFDKDLNTDTKIYLVKRLTYKGHTGLAADLIANSQEIREQGVVERMIREALRGQQFDKVLEWISYLDEENQQSDRWQYWRARAQDELGLTANKTASSDIYQQLAQKRSFYGFLSSDKLDVAYTLGHKPSAVTQSTMMVVRNLPAIKRARELWLKGHYGEAKAEWQFSTRKMSSSELAAAGKIAERWGWYNKGIHAMIRGNFWDDLDVRFPLAFKEEVEKVSSNTAVEQTLIYAIARQESAFSKNATSHAGARGLMQLMPGTARQTARKNGIKHRDSYLFDPEYNIQIGSSYLNELLSKYNGNRILAAAAYNAGPHRVSKWIQKTPLDLPYDVWIETIPFRETRGYVQNVLAFSVIYAHKLGKKSEFITENETGVAQR